MTAADDGFTGTNFERPDFKRMIEDIKDGKIDCVITKDLSRLGRNYLDCGLYQEVFFPEHHVRYIAINDGVDTMNRAGMDITPFRNILNEMYAADISMKVKSAVHARFKAGKYRSSNAPYGYRKDPADHNKLLVDESVAPVVQMIYDHALQGEGVRTIRNYLNSQHIERPSAHAIQRGETNFEYKQTKENRYHWTENAVRMILRNPVYAGNLCGYKRVAVGMKSKKKLCRAPADWEVVPGTHEGIVSQTEFDTVQAMMDARHNGGRPYAHVENLFQGLLHCADCGQVMRLTPAHRQRREDPLDNHIYVCNNYCSYGLNACSQHKIEAREVQELVLQDINRLGKMALEDAAFADTLRKKVCSQSRQTMKAAQTEQKRLDRRLSELDKMFAALYEDKVMGRIPARNYEQLSAKYVAEQTELEQRTTQLRQEIAAGNEQEQQVTDFAALIARYAGIQELNKAMLFTLIEDIRVYEPTEDESGHVFQQVKIVYKMVGALDETTVIEPKPVVWSYAPIHCEICGKEFTPKGARAQFCPACAKERTRQSSNANRTRKRHEQKRILQEGHPFAKRVCPVCGKEFWPEKGGNQKYCGEECHKQAAKAAREAKRQNLGSDEVASVV